MEYTTSGNYVAFRKPLREGRIIDRPNRFIVNAEVDGETIECHCPVSGRIGGYTLNGLPLLVSGPYEGRRTTHNVEAIGLTQPEDPNFQWIGVNQTRINAYVESLLVNNAFRPMLGEPLRILRREVKLEDRRIDFLVDGTWLEVKMPLLKVHAAAGPEVPLKEFPKGPPSDRLPEQLKAMVESGRRTILLTCFQYQNNLGTSREQQMNENIYPEDVEEALAAGVEMWVAEYTFSPNGILLKTVEKFA